MDDTELRKDCLHNYHYRQSGQGGMPLGAILITPRSLLLKPPIREQAREDQNHASNYHEQDGQGES